VEIESTSVEKNPKLLDCLAFGLLSCRPTTMQASFSDHTTRTVLYYRGSFFIAITTYFRQSKVTIKEAVYGSVDFC